MWQDNTTSFFKALFHHCWQHNNLNIVSMKKLQIREELETESRIKESKKRKDKRKVQTPFRWCLLEIIIKLHFDSYFGLYQTFCSDGILLAVTI